MMLFFRKNRNRAQGVHVVNSSRGFSLISVLIGAAIAGIIAATLASLFENMTRLSVRSTVVSEIDNFQRFIEGILAQKALCQFALRQSGPGLPQSTDRILMPGGAGIRPVPVIRITDGSSTPIIAAENNMAISTSLTLSTVGIRHRDTDGDDVGNVTAGAPILINGVNYTNYAAELVLRFTWSGPAGSLVGGGQLQTRKIPLLVSVNGAGEIELCNSVDTATLQFTCTIAKSGCPVPATRDWADRACLRVPYIEQVDPRGRPVCKCRVICSPPPVDTGVSPKGTPTSTSPLAPPPAAAGPGVGPGAVSN